METTKNKLTPYAKDFFNKLTIYLNTKIYYYGSIQRNDYFQGSSDIDVDIFTDNEQSTISKLQNFLGVNKYEFKKFAYKLHKSKKMVWGHKVSYKNKPNNFVTEISIYNEKHKDDVLLEHNSKMKLPFYVSYLLILVKIFYYSIPILSKDIYIYLKKIILNDITEGTSVEFVVTEIPKDKEQDQLHQEEIERHNSN